MTKGQEEEKNNLNKSVDLKIDRGLDLILRAGRKPLTNKKTFQFNKVLKFLHKTYSIKIEVDIKNL
jgi:hypothetical protein